MSLNQMYTLPSFSGNENDNIEHFLDLFNSIAMLENWEAPRKLLMLKLNCKDQALKFLLEDSIASKTNEVDSVIKLLREKFKQKKSFKDIQNKYTKISQKPSQNTKNLSEEISTVVNELVNGDNSQDATVLKLIENMKLTKFLEALRSDIRIEVKKRGVKTFEQAVSVASDIEQAIEEEASSDNTKYNFHLNTLLEQQLENNKTIQALSEQINAISSTSQVNAIKSEVVPAQALDQRIYCHICGKNHLTTVCWYYPTNLMHQSQGSGFRGRNRYNNRGNRRFNPYYGRQGRNFNRRSSDNSLNY